MCSFYICIKMWNVMSNQCQWFTSRNISIYQCPLLSQRWSNIFGFDSDSNLFPRILNIRIRIREFWRPNNIRIFEYFSSNLEYLKHIFFLLILNINWEFLGALPTCLSHLRAPIEKTCAWMLLSLDTFMSFLEYAFSIPVFCSLFSTFCSNITELFE